MDEMQKIPTMRWDAAEHLETEEDMAAYLEAALEEGDASLVAVSQCGFPWRYPPRDPGPRGRPPGCRAAVSRSPVPAGEARCHRRRPG